MHLWWLMAPNKVLSNIPVLKKSFAGQREKSVRTGSQEMIREDSTVISAFVSFYVVFFALSF